MLLYNCSKGTNKKRKKVIIMEEKLLEMLNYQKKKEEEKKMKEEREVIEKLVLDMVKNYGISPEYAINIILERITPETIERLRV